MIVATKYQKSLIILSASATFTLAGCSNSLAKLDDKAISSKEPSKQAISAASFVDLTPDTEAALHLKQENVALRDVDFAVKSTGEVQANANLTTKVSTPVSGRVIKVFVNTGDHVADGQTLATINSQDIEQTEADLLQNASQVRADLKRDLLQIDFDINQNRAQLGLSESTYMRVKGLLDEKIASQADFESAKTQYDRDHLTIDGLNAKRQATISLSNERLNLLTEPLKQKLHLFGVSDGQINEVIKSGKLNPVIKVVAPESGVVTERLVNYGELTDPSRAIFTIGDFNSVWLKADVYEKDVAKVKVGQPIELEVDSFPDQIFKGKLNYVADSINPDTRTLTVRAEVLNPGCKLKPKMFARMKILVGKHRVLTLPKMAVQDAENFKVVYVPLGHGRFREQHVKLGGESGSLDEVVAGLKAGEPVIVKGSFELRSEALKQSN